MQITLAEMAALFDFCEHNGGYYVYLQGSHLLSNDFFSGLAFLLRMLLLHEPNLAFHAAYPRATALSGANRIGRYYQRSTRFIGQSAIHKY
jgi:hypothetical protein